MLHYQEWMHIKVFITIRLILLHLELLDISSDLITALKTSLAKIKTTRDVMTKYTTMMSRICDKNIQTVYERHRKMYKKNYLTTEIKYRV